MMGRVVLFEDAVFANLLPLTYWRTVFELRCGRLGLGERLGKMLGTPASGLWTRDWIANVAAERSGLPINQPVQPGDLLVNGRWIPERPVNIEEPPYVATHEGQIAYVACDEKLAKRLAPEDFLDRSRWPDVVSGTRHGRVEGPLIQYPWDLVVQTPPVLHREWDMQDARIDGEVHDSAVLLNESAIQVAAGASVGPLAVIDATEGPVFIDSGATVRQHACVSGPAYVGRHSVIHPHTFIHGGTSIGPVCKIGGEVAASVFQGYSNKAHSGFLGHAYVGSWVNIGADTTNSNLKNTYGTVRVPINGQDVDTGLTFFGCIFGDHVKTGIQQAISTGSVFGFAANVAGSRILPHFVRSFTWLTDGGLEDGDAERLARTAAKAMERRDVTMTEAEHALFEKLAVIVEYFEPSALSQRAIFEAASDRGRPEPMPSYGEPGTR